MRTTQHGRAVGAALGNPQPDPTTLVGTIRKAHVLLQFGDLETQFGIQTEPLAVFERQRGWSRILTTFTREVDAERYLLILGRPGIVPEPWDDGHVRYTWPDGVELDDAMLNVKWQAEDGAHEMTSSSLRERTNLCLAAWARDVSIEELLARAARN